MTEEALELEVSLLAAELELTEQLIDRGIITGLERRLPTAVELAAGVRFAALDRIVEQTAGLIARKVNRVRDHVLDGLAEELGGIMAEADPYVALEQLDALTDPTRADTLPGLRGIVDEVAGELEEDLVAAARQGHAEALDEARRQGIPDRLIDDRGLDEDEARAAARQQAGKIAKHPAERVLNAAAEAGGRAATAPGANGLTVLEGALAGAEETSRAGTEDLARQGANVTSGIGRRQAQAQLPAPAEVYASELLDSSTCGPCATLDGRQYDSLESGLADYPGAGGYIGCDGGARCRGTLVLVHATEAPPTRDTPGGPGGRPAPIDRTPRGPSGVGRPDHIAPDGSLIPRPPDKGTPPPPELPLAQLDDAGRTVIDPAQLEAPIETVAPVDVDRDPELATYSDDELDALMADPSADPDRVMAAAVEYDRRQAGEVEQVWAEDQLDAATLARYEDEREAWEAAGGYAATASARAVEAVTRPAGRRIDAVRAEWMAEIEHTHIRADQETNGYLVRKDRKAEFDAKYPGQGATAVLFEGPARVAYYYASDELRAWWRDNPRSSFAEFAVARGIADAKTTARAKAAKTAREDAEARADEDRGGRQERGRQEQRKRRASRRLPMTEGERLVKAQQRRDRVRAAERKAAAERRALGSEE